MRAASLSFLLLAAFPLYSQEIVVGEGKLEFKSGGELVTTYYHGKEVAKPYWWPLNAPGEITVTRGYPIVKDLPKETSKDHPHHKSGWFCHGDVIPEGLTIKTKTADPHVKGVDFWSELPGHGVIRCTKVGEITKKPHEASVVTYNDWNSADGVKVLEEVRTITLVDLNKTGRLIIMDSELIASQCPITFGDTKEGSFGVRISDQIREVIDEKKKIHGGTLTLADGKTLEKNVWGQVSHWCDYSGKQDGKEAGLTIFASPKNTIPTAWHSRAYGLMAANPFGREVSGFPSQKGKRDLVKIARGDKLKLTYVIYLHTGDVKSGQVTEAYEKFVGR
ncbi:PmoA family protein [Telmatocola sphagniphila]|uniref:PmoA family protein n=1 Tax=Telmatocola sphagniphila TaxID=1123043 RepID=A0A8E6ETG3_9BACT|nr:PmoA family protein [Telmatocola sphagniphila]QVL30055.1 PmoA family protein [Telmatocola sphagniphila]